MFLEAMIPPEFWLNCKKSNAYKKKADDWFFMAQKWKAGSIERQICELKVKLYERESLKYLLRANAVIQKKYE
ncbi:MAG: hypothetical protein KatS3mg101_0996 [Patescibacteria group bacterium]|nr:MAG: hypothetical protein KatS3mg101_0996 [Patescibacteria group bacterium]